MNLRFREVVAMDFCSNFLSLKIVVKVKVQNNVEVVKADISSRMFNWLNS